MAILSSGPINIGATDVFSDGVKREVVPRPSSTVQLFCNLGFDLTVLTNWSVGFIANFQIMNYQTGVRSNTIWQGPLAGNIPQAPSVFITWGASAASVGMNTPGIYLYRPTFTVLIPNPAELPAFIGLSHFAVAEEHYLLLEG